MSSPFSFASAKRSFPRADVSTDLDPRKRRNDLFQSVTALEDGLAGEVTAVTPEQVEQIIYDRSRRALLPLLEQLKPGDAFRVQRNNFAVQNG
ncbi:MAG TPA: hypothetical protein VFO40_10915 [Chthoniobacterales bacterium]|nr:hypothetical protein [Chthoniobacterales bacterium]